MKIFLQIISLFWAMQCVADEDAATFKMANTAFKAHKYAESLEIYQSMIDNGAVNAHIYYNMGNAYYKMAQYSDAILVYERALKIKPEDKDIRNNLLLAYNKVGNKHPDVVVKYKSTLLDQIVATLSVSQWCKLMLICLWLGAIAFIVFLYQKHHRRRIASLIVTSILLLLCITSMCMGFLRIHQQNVATYAIVSGDMDYCKSDPAYSAGDVYALAAGQKLRIIDRSGEWMKVRNGIGQEGWIASKNVKEI